MGKSCKPPPIPLPSAGMFLRGYGSQTVNVYQGHIFRWKDQTYSSDELGKIQQDATRPFQIDSPNVLSVDSEDAYNLTWGRYIPGWDNEGEKWYQLGGNDSPSGLYPGAISLAAHPKGSQSFHGMGWIMTRPPKKYELHGHGGEHASYSLSESPDTESGLQMFMWELRSGSYAGMQLPTTDEIRPINVAVRYFIKAR